MIILKRILLFNFCILVSLLNHTQAAEIAAQNSELLDKNYVLIEVSNENAVSVSVLQSLKNLTQFVEAKFYSLLNWQSHTRHTQIEIPNYDRVTQFGRWINDPNDDVCFNTRAKVLVRDSTKRVIFKDTNRCVVDQGAWDDPYTAKTFKNSADIQIDHLVPLKNTYLSGGYKWSFKARCLYANYLGEEFHLVSSSGTENMRKGDKTPEKYMPPNPDHACTYVRNWLAVKLLWGLTMSPSEATSIQQIISDNNCSLGKFRISDRELSSQRKFAQDNIDLCEKIDRSLN